jgi:hypothetical protein
LEQAKTPADFKFKQHRPIDIEKIKASEYYMGPIQRAQSASLAVSLPGSFFGFQESPIPLCSFVG